MNLVRVLRDAGLTVRDERRSSAPGPFAPIGVMNHHTAGPKTGDAPSLAFIKRGTSTVPGPLTQVLIGRSGTCYVVADGRAHHGGGGSSVVLAETRKNIAPSGTAYSRGLAQDTDGNTHYVGIEIENAGDGKDIYPTAQRIAVIKANAAILLALGHPHANRSIAHKEWSRVKIDPRGFTMKWLRRRVAEELEDAMFTEDEKKFLKKLVKEAKEADTTALNLGRVVKNFRAHKENHDGAHTHKVTGTTE